jgi:hypothetical protein
VIEDKEEISGKSPQKTAVPVGALRFTASRGGGQKGDTSRLKADKKVTYFSERKRFNGRRQTETQRNLIR